MGWTHQLSSDMLPTNVFGVWSKNSPGGQFSHIALAEREAPGESTLNTTSAARSSSMLDFAKYLARCEFVDASLMTILRSLEPGGQPLLVSFRGWTLQLVKSSTYSPSGKAKNILSV